MAGSDLAATEKKAAVEKRTILCIDEAAFYLLPSVVRTWSPIGVSPVLNAVCCRDHLSAISAITPEGKLYFHLQEGAFDGMDVVRFVCHLLRHIPGKLLIVWDGASIHKGEAIRRLLATDRENDLWLESFPAYAPELNPDEGIWNCLKNVELKNLCCSDLKELRQKILQAVKRLRQKTHIIKACFQQAGLKL
ncbi:MAG: transposase [Acidimicrobiales bacterium]|nr:transposase [Acidimicrobiales bacterium]